MPYLRHGGIVKGQRKIIIVRIPADACAPKRVPRSDASWELWSWTLD